ncbi:ATP-binding protein [Tamlana sp. s12]|uniref:ATP-dependent nuclease n=1 Tax=Tamlana sp. s12 TaxID=1630406 RepID=UPI0008393181|nr:ATP-binding protein [Tamlana sp. s12]QQY81168.1 ATP-binding protein [Tamlana sp. s12]
MNIQEFGISNYRSFDEKGVYLCNLKKINVIIGKNNCGKSNVLRFLQTLNFIIKDLNKFPNDIQNQHRRNGEQSVLHLKIKGDEFPIDKNKIRPHLKFDYKNFLSEFHNFSISLNSQKIKLPEFFENLTPQQLEPFQTKYSTASRIELINTIEQQWTKTIIAKIQSSFSDLIYIPHLRVIKEGHSYGDSNSSINGSNIISKMFEMQNPVIGDEKSREKFNLIQAFVRELINKPDLEIEIPHTKEEIVLTIDGNRLPLESFGTGIHQLVIMCSTLVIHENSVVCIEEPEIHLHPELQRKFIRFLNKTKNIYFITTHSNIFLDSRYNTSIYHVLNDGIKSTIYNAKRTDRTFSILNDLGYHSSDILQANGIIWVEGPSDRIYILKWIELLDNTLIEGLHFSIMFYGGKLLSHLSFDNEQMISELIPLLKLNRNAFVLMDRDGFSKQTKINPTKSRIKKELGDRNSWVTKGREIENYLTSNTIKSWLGIENLKIDSDKKLEDIIASKSTKKYSSNKSRFSAEIVKHIEVVDLDILDLKLKITQLVKRVKKWNE